jgi:Protein of unknown function (DUF2934)
MELQMQDLEHTIRERAYHLWVADGCNDGNADSHWLLAQREVLASSLDGIARVSTETETAARPAKKTKAKTASTKTTTTTKRKSKAA